MYLSSKLIKGATNDITFLTLSVTAVNIQTNILLSENVAAGATEAVHIAFLNAAFFTEISFPLLIIRQSKNVQQIIFTKDQ
jgi:hypothetical protein